MNIIPNKAFHKYLDTVIEKLIFNGYATYELDAELLKDINDIFFKANDFFSLSKQEKMESANQEVLEGYRELGIEYSQTPDRPDLNDTFSVWKRNINQDTIKSWASQNPLHQAMTLALEPFTNLGNSLFEVLQTHIKPDGQPIEVSDLSYLQINNYEPRKFERELLQDSHEDGHLLTIVKATSPGLEIMINNQFNPVSLNEKEVLLMPGSILTAITGGIIKPLYHRVRNNPLIDFRRSLMFFINPSISREQNIWIENETNLGINVRTLAIENSGHFGLPKLEK